MNDPFEKKIEAPDNTQMTDAAENIEDQGLDDISEDTKRAIKRVLITLALFVVIFWVDLGVEDSIRYLAAVIGAGCYWIGSNQK